MNVSNVLDLFKKELRNHSDSPVKDANYALWELLLCCKDDLLNSDNASEFLDHFISKDFGDNIVTKEKGVVIYDLLTDRVSETFWLIFEQCQDAKEICNV